MTETPGYRPLYRQVYDIVVNKVAKGTWRPGESLPSELNLAKELGVSQGTVRKVLDALTAEKLLERRQGKGTYIAENTQERSLFRFFRLSRPGGKRLTPERAAESVKVRAARPSSAASWTSIARTRWWKSRELASSMRVRRFTKSSSSR